MKKLVMGLVASALCVSVTAMAIPLMCLVGTVMKPGDTCGIWSSRSSNLAVTNNYTKGSVTIGQNNCVAAVDDKNLCNNYCFDTSSVSGSVTVKINDLSSSTVKFTTSKCAQS